MIQAPALLRPSTWLLIAINLVPLVGVYAWGWDGFVLLVLYWLETASIAFWTLARILITPRGGSTLPSRLAMAIATTLHAGVFMAVHMIFLWVLFSGTWSDKIHGVDDFISEMIIGTGMWLPLLALFIGRGLMMLFDVVRPALLRSARIKDPTIAAPASMRDSGIVSGLYARIVVMQLTIIFGAWATTLSGGRGSLVLVIAIKTAVDLAITLRAEHQSSRAQTQSAADAI